MVLALLDTKEVEHDGAPDAGDSGTHRPASINEQLS
jgi:hypothetical protein